MAFKKVVLVGVLVSVLALMIVPKIFGMHAQQSLYKLQENNRLIFFPQRSVVTQPVLKSEVGQIIREAPNLNPKVLTLGLRIYDNVHAKGLDKQQLLTIIDYSKPSTDARLWVIDLKNKQILFNEYVAHGKNSGANLPTRFSDNASSLESSLGVFLTGATYLGQHGYSLHVIGLEPGFNEQAEARSIVFHPANYVSTQFAKLHGRLGRSWGCFAINPTISQALIQTIKNGTLLFVYYPDPHWLSTSRFLM